MRARSTQRCALQPPSTCRRCAKRPSVCTTGTRCAPCWRTSWCRTADAARVPRATRLVRAMHPPRPRLILAVLAFAAWLAPLAVARAADTCPRPEPGSAVPEARDLHSTAGVLQLDLSVHNVKEPDGSVRYCYLLGDGTQSPTLR